MISQRLELGKRITFSVTFLNILRYENSEALNNNGDDLVWCFGHIRASQAEALQP